MESTNTGSTQHPGRVASKTAGTQPRIPEKSPTATTPRTYEGATENKVRTLSSVLVHHGLPTIANRMGSPTERNAIRANDSATSNTVVPARSRTSAATGRRWANDYPKSPLNVRRSEES